MSETGRKDDGFSSDYWGQEKESHKFSKPQSFYLVFSNMADFFQGFGVAFCFFQFLQHIPCWQTAHQLFTGYGDLQLQSLGFLFDCKRAASGTPSPAAAEVVSQSAGPATDQDPEGVKGSVSGPLERIYFIILVLEIYHFLYLPPYAQWRKSVLNMGQARFPSEGKFWG